MDEVKNNLANVRHTILVLSGKGGVGKSTVATQLALGLKNAGKKVGILDIDLCGPSIPRMVGVEGHDVHQCPQGWVPVYPDPNLAIMSISFLLGNQDDAVVWRGPKKNAMIKQFLTDVVWGELDYLIIDTPPDDIDDTSQCGESPVSQPDGAVLVTTPQAVAVGDVRRELTFCRKTKLRVLGLVENMSGFVCPHCAECSNVFSQGGGESLAKECQVPYLGNIPLDPKLANCSESGQSFIEAFPSSPSSQAIQRIVQSVLASTNTSQDTT
eukprot:XP_011681818.1 PREDICTED: cytosolic Fe-S cluster assembly factor NUBP2 homolog [Strongylocentrotus purpuratus]